MNQQELRECLEQMLTLLSLSFEDINVSTEGEILRLDIVSNVASKIIGWHGESLNSLQHLLKCAARTKFSLEESPNIVIDVDGYRRQQEEKVIAMAERKVDFVRRQGKRIALPPMSPYFRRVVHLHISGNDAFDDITTESIGRGGQRQIVLRLKDDTRGVPDEASGEMNPVIADENESEGGEWGNLDV